MVDIHSAAQDGFSKGATNYRRGRPGYPNGIVKWLRDRIGLQPGMTAIDLAAGTGKFTESLLQTGAQVIAIEPVDAMRAQLAEALPPVEALAGTAEAMPLANGYADAVLSAQAFHWFATRESLEEIRRVLKTGGRLGLVWNLPDDRVDWVVAYNDILGPFEAASPYLFRRGEWRKVFAGGIFTAPEETLMDHQYLGTAQEVIVDRALSLSFIASLLPAEQAKVTRALANLICTHPQLTGRSTIAFPYRTYAYRCVSMPL